MSKSKKEKIIITLLKLNKTVGNTASVIVNITYRY